MRKINASSFTRRVLLAGIALPGRLAWHDRQQARTLPHLRREEGRTADGLRQGLRMRRSRPAGELHDADHSERDADDDRIYRADIEFNVHGRGEKGERS
jgi:hypothetical protein